MEVRFEVLDRLVRESFVPKVLLVTSPAAARACAKSGGASLASLLAPYCAFPEERIQLKGAREEPYFLQGFQVKIIEASDMCLTSLLGESLEERLTDAVRGAGGLHVEEAEARYGGCHVTSKESALKFVEQCRAIDRTKPLLPWFDAYQQIFLQNLAVSEHETFGHPVACIFVMCSDEVQKASEVSNSFVAMTEEVLRMPNMYETGFMDTNFYKFHILLHDNHSGPSTHAEHQLKEMRKTFGDECKLLKINSLPADSPQTKKDGSKTFLTMDDCMQLQVFMKEFIFRRLLTYMEKKILHLEDIVAGLRRSRTGTFSRFFFGSRKRTADCSPETSATGLRYYGCNTPPAQTRQLGDLCLMTGDFESALANYKACLVDYKNDRCNKYLAGATEMVALCNTLLGQQRKDSEKELESVGVMYMKELQPRFAARTLLLLSSMKRCRNRFMEAASICIRAAESFKDPLISALFQEQAAFCYLFKYPTPMFRMFTMRLVMASDAYAAAGQLVHALGCCYAAYPTYEGQRWSTLKDHVEFSIGRHSFLLGDLTRSTKFFQLLLTDSQQAPETQSSFFREYLRIFQAAAEKGDVMPSVNLPVISGDSVRVQLNTQYADEREPQWLQLEDWAAYEEQREDARMAFRSFYPAFFNPRDPKMAFKKHASAVGEWIHVEFQVHNPLRIPLQLYSCQLVCDHYSPEEGLNENGEPPTPLPATNEAAYVVDPVDLLLAPMQTTTLRFSVKPVKEGLLEIRALGFQLAGEIWAKSEFPVRTRRLHKTKQQRVSKAVEADLSMSIQIASAMPLLEVDFPKLPPYLLHNEVRKYSVTLRNTGEVDLKNVKICMDRPGFFVFGKPSELDLPFPPTSGREGDNSGREDGTDSEKSGREGYICGEKNVSKICETYDLSLVHVDVSTLSPGASVSLPLWVRGVSLGPAQFSFVFYYEPAEEKEIRYRVLRQEATTRVVPSIKSSVLVNLSHSSIDGYVLGLDLSNEQASYAFSITQVSSVSGRWAIEKLSSQRYEECKIQPLESTTVFFQVRPIQQEGELLLSHTEQSLVAGQLLNSAAVPYAELLDRARRPLPHSYNTNFTYLHDDPLPAISSIVSPSKLDVVVFWRTEKEERMGMIAIRHIALLPDTPKMSNGKALKGSIPSMFSSMGSRRSSFDENNEPLTGTEFKKMVERAQKHQEEVTITRFERLPLRFQISSDVQVQHDFTSASICTVALTVTVANPSLKQSLRVTFETIETDDKKKHDPRSKGAALSEFFWLGMTRQYIDHLKPQERRQLIVKACFHKAGIFNVSRMRFLVTPFAPGKGEGEVVTGKERAIYCSTQHLVCVTDSSRPPVNV